MQGVDWTHHDYYTSVKGMVIKTEEGWVGKVQVSPTQLGRIRETYQCAEVAMKAVERVWERECKKG